MPPEPITVTLSRIFIHHEVSRGELLIALNQKLGLISNGNLVACGTALPEKINETMNIPLVCMTAYQRILANLDNIFWDYGVPLLCIGALGVGIFCLKRFKDYVDNVGTITIDQDRWQEGLWQLAQNSDGTKIEPKPVKSSPSRDVHGRIINEETGRGRLNINPSFSTSRFDKDGGLLDPNGYPITKDGYLDIDRVQRDENGQLPNWLANADVKNAIPFKPYDPHDHDLDPDVWGIPEPPPPPPTTNDNLDDTAFGDFLKNFPDDDPKPTS